MHADSGLYAPTDVEATDEDLLVSGVMPAALNGVYVRIGPNPYHCPIGNYHWWVHIHAFTRMIVAWLHGQASCWGHTLLFTWTLLQCLLATKKHASSDMDNADYSLTVCRFDGDGMVSAAMSLPAIMCLGIHFDVSDRSCLK